MSSSRLGFVFSTPVVEVSNYFFGRNLEFPKIIKSRKCCSDKSYCQKAMLVWSKILHRNSTLYLKWSIRIVLFEWANPGIFLFIFVLFTLKLYRQLYNLNCINWKNLRVSNPRPAGWKVLIIPLSYGGLANPFCCYSWGGKSRYFPK